MHLPSPQRCSPTSHESYAHRYSCPCNTQMSRLGHTTVHRNNIRSSFLCTERTLFQQQAKNLAHHCWLDNIASQYPCISHCPDTSIYPLDTPRRIPCMTTHTIRSMDKSLLALRPHRIQSTDAPRTRMACSHRSIDSSGTDHAHRAPVHTSTVSHRKTPQRQPQASTYHHSPRHSKPFSMIDPKNEPTCFVESPRQKHASGFTTHVPSSGQITPGSRLDVTHRKRQSNRSPTQ